MTVLLQMVFELHLKLPVQTNVQVHFVLIDNFSTRQTYLKCDEILIHLDKCHLTVALI